MLGKSGKLVSLLRETDCDQEGGSCAESQIQGAGTHMTPDSKIFTLFLPTITEPNVRMIGR
jgi:hypothetical protein